MSLSGENGAFMKEVKQLDTTTRLLDGRVGAWKNQVDYDKLLAAEKLWISSLQQSSTRTELVSGFKEIRIDSIPFIIEMFPGAYHIVNYRKIIPLNSKANFTDKVATSTW